MNYRLIWEELEIQLHQQEIYLNPNYRETVLNTCVQAAEVKMSASFQ